MIVRLASLAQEAGLNAILAVLLPPSGHARTAFAPMGSTCRNPFRLEFKLRLDPRVGHDCCRSNRPPAASAWLITVLLVFCSSWA
jgi:hypothetical protein